MTRCLVIQPIHEAGLTLLERSGITPVRCDTPDEDEVIGRIGPCAGVITRDAGLSGRAIRAAPQLRVIAVHGAGHDPVDKAAAAARGAILCTTPGANAQSVAELALGLALAAARQIPGANRAERGGERGFREARHFVELAGKTALIVGWGHTGRALGAILSGGLGMRVLCYSPSMPEVVGAQRVARLEDGLAEADLISLHTPLTDRTRGLMSAARFASIRPGAILINTARAGLIDEGALIDALGDGRIAAAGLDVFSAGAPQGPLGHCERVVFTPHLGGTTEEALRRTALAAAENVIVALVGKAPCGVVDLGPWRTSGGMP